MVKNLAITSVTVAPSPVLTGTTLQVAQPTRLPEGEAFWATIAPPGVQPAGDPEGNAEIVLVESVAGKVLTVKRAQGGQSAKAVAVGWVLYAGMTKEFLESLTVNGKKLPATLNPIDVGAPAQLNASQFSKAVEYAAGSFVKNEGYVWTNAALVKSGKAFNPVEWTKLGVELARESVWASDPQFGALAGAGAGDQSPKWRAAAAKAGETSNLANGKLSAAPGLYEFGNKALPAFGRELFDYKSVGLGFPEPFTNVFSYLNLPKGVTIDGIASKFGVQLRVAAGCNAVAQAEIEAMGKANARGYALSFNGASASMKMVRDLTITTADGIPSNHSLSKVVPSQIDLVLACGAGEIANSVITGAVASAVVMRCDHFKLTQCNLGGWSRLRWPVFVGPAGNNVIENCDMVGGFCAVYVEPGGFLGGTSFVRGHMGFCSGPCFYKPGVLVPRELFASFKMERTDIEEPGRGILQDDSMSSTLRKVELVDLLVGSGGIGPNGGRLRGDVTQPASAVVQAGLIEELTVQGRCFTNPGFEPGIACCIRAEDIKDCDLGDITDGLHGCRSLGIPFMRALTQENVRAEAIDQIGTRVSVYFRTVSGGGNPVSRYDLMEPVPSPELNFQVPVAEMFARRLQTAGQRPDGIALQSVAPGAGEVAHVPLAVPDRRRRGMLVARLAHLGIGGYELPIVNTNVTVNQTIKVAGGQTLKAPTGGFPPTGELEVGVQTVSYTGITATEFTGVSSTHEIAVTPSTLIRLVQWPPNKRGAKAKLVGDGITAGAPVSLGEGLPQPISLHISQWNNERIRKLWLSTISDLPSSSVLSTKLAVLHYSSTVVTPTGNLAAESNTNPSYLQVPTAANFPAVPAGGHETLEVAVRAGGARKLFLKNGTITLSFKWSGVVYTTEAFHVLKEETAEGVKVGLSAEEVAAKVQAAKGPEGQVLPGGAIKGLSGILCYSTVVLQCEGAMTGLVRDLKCVVGESLGTGTNTEFGKPTQGTIRVGTLQATYAGVNPVAPATEATAVSKPGGATITVASVAAFEAQRGAVRVKSKKTGLTQTVYYHETHVAGGVQQFKLIPKTGEAGAIVNEIEPGDTVEGFPELTDLTVTSGAFPVGTLVVAIGHPSELLGLSGAGSEKGLGAKSKLFRALHVDSLLGFSETGGVVKIVPQPITEPNNVVFALYQGLIEAEARSRYVGAEIASPFSTANIPAIIGAGDTAFFASSGTFILEAQKGGTPAPMLVEVSYTGKSLATTTLSAEANFATATEVKVADTSAFPAVGWLKIGNAEVRYVSKTATSFKLETGAVFNSNFEPTTSGVAVVGTQVTCPTFTGCKFVKASAATAGFKIGGASTTGLYDPTTVRKFLTGVASEGYFVGSAPEAIAAGTQIEDVSIIGAAGSSGYPNGPAAAAVQTATGTTLVPYEKFVSITGEPQEEGEEPSGEEEERGSESEAPELGEVSAESAIRAYFVVSHAGLITEGKPQGTGAPTVGATLLTAAIANLSTATSIPVYSVDGWPGTGVLSFGATTVRYGKLAEARTTVLTTVPKMEGTFNLKVASVTGFPAAGGLRIGKTFVTYTALSAVTNTFEGCKVDTTIEGSVEGVAATEGQTVKQKPEFLELTERSASGVALAQYQPVGLAFGLQIAAGTVVGAATDATRLGAGDQGLITAASPGDVKRYPFAVTGGPDEGGSVQVELGAV